MTLPELVEQKKRRHLTLTVNRVSWGYQGHSGRQRAPGYSDPLPGSDPVPLRWPAGGYRGQGLLPPHISVPRMGRNRAKTDAPAEPGPEGTPPAAVDGWTCHRSRN